MAEVVGGRGRRVSMGFALAAFCVAVVAAVLVVRAFLGVQSQLEDAMRAPVTTSVVASKAMMEPGHEIVSEDLELVAVPAHAAAEGQLYTDAAALVGLVPQERILAGEPIRKERFTPPATDGGALARLLATGLRAVTVQLARAPGLGGLVRPGDLVDVIVTIRPDDDRLNADWVTETILQRVRVLAVGRGVLGAEEPTDKSETQTEAVSRAYLVTVEVSPEEAEKLALAAARGDLHLSLRGPTDEDTVGHGGPLVANALVGLGSDPQKRMPSRIRRSTTPTAPAAPGGTSVEIIEGEKRTVEQFDADGRRVKP